MKELLGVAALIGFMLVFVGMWVGVCLLISRIGGWSTVAARYPADAVPAGETFRMQSASFGGANYSSCLTITASPAGLHLEVLVPFRPGHRPIFLPAAVIKRAKIRKILWTRMVQFEVGEPSLATLTVGKKVFEAHRPVLDGTS
ncbi:hypothetical protein [Luteolibacter marinus]|uniref:hypothetical protein n=1 Tax=Luteolibacter marinus TaxID=2776705 RepID=UPI0018665FFD|nr:hypothetical protein [Luteolibacter marinus]